MANCVFLVSYFAVIGFIIDSVFCLICEFLLHLFIFFFLLVIVFIGSIHGNFASFISFFLFFGYCIYWIHTWPSTVHDFQNDDGRVLSQVFGITHYSYGRHGIEEV